MTTAQPRRRVRQRIPSPRDSDRCTGSIRRLAQWLITLLALTGLGLSGTAARAATITSPTIDSASWSASEGRLRTSGKALAGAQLTLLNAYDPGQRLGSTVARTSDNTWSIRVDRPRPVPCRVRAVQADGKVVERAVSNAPSTCSPKAPPANLTPTAKANGPYSGTATVAITFSSAGSSDPDGSIAAYAWNFGDNTTSTDANPSHAFAATGTYTVTLRVTDNLGAASAVATTTATLSAPPVACASSIPEHCGIQSYTGPEVCVACHEGQARDMHGSVHYQQGGAFPNVTNIPTDFAAAGERPAKAAGDLVATGINTYCGTHENSPRFTCAGCHVGNGRFPMAQSDFVRLSPGSTESRLQLANIDCLMCHQQVYKRFPDWTPTGEGFSPLTLLNLTVDAAGNLVRADGGSVTRTGLAGIPNVSLAGDFLFRPAGKDTLPATAPMAPMPITTLEAARSVHATTRQSCLNCHAGAGGADGAKRGDLSRENANPSLAVDLHMSPAGADLTCSDCHTAVGPSGESHRVRGRGLDLRANDVPERFTCAAAGCHSERPHGDFSTTDGKSRDTHALKVACQTCHIPAYAKAAVGTEVARDWQDPHPSNSACNGRGGWLPREDKGGLGTASLTPLYRWFDGTSEVTYLSESLIGVPTVKLDAAVAAKFVAGFTSQDNAYVTGQPNGDVTSTTAKIYPMKGHWGTLARNDATNSLVAHSTFEFFRTGSFCRAVAVGLGLDQPNTEKSSVCGGVPGALEMPPGTSVVPVFTYQTINHGVEVEANALGGDTAGCGSCHQALTGGTLKMDLPTLGYGLRTNPSAVAGTNVTTLNGSLDRICSQCHDNKQSTTDRAFAEVHKRHVTDKKKDCAACHNFSRPERGLSLSKG